MAVTIDIPGIGQVEAKNAASEATLKEILAVMKGVQGNTKKKGGGGDDGGGGGGGKNPLTSVAGKLGQTFGKLSASVMPVIGGFASLSKFLTNTISEFANVGDSVENAAKVIPIFGGTLSKIAGASVKLNDAFLDASRSGATFGGSVNEFARSASEAGMTLENFGKFIAQNGQGMLAFGGTTEEGAKRFTQVSKALRQTSGDLYALGFSSEDINKGLANYGALLRAQGLQGKQSNSELVAGAKKYMKELDALAKITGEERSAKEAEMKKLAQDAQFQAAMAGKSEEVRSSFMRTVTSLPAPLQGFVKDFLATGTLTSEETQRIGAMMGGEVMNELQNMRNKMQAGQALTAAEQDRLAAIMKAAGEKQLKANSAALAASRENDAATAALTAATTLQTDAHKKAAAEQNKAAKEGDGFNKKMQEIQQRLAQFSNAFTQVLAKSGILDVIMGAFTVMANLVMTFIVPAFNMLTSVISGIGKFISNYLYPAFLELAAFVIVDIIEPIKKLGSELMQYMSPAIDAVSSGISWLSEKFNGLAEYFEGTLKPVMMGLAAGVGVVTAAYLIKNGVLLAATLAQGALTLATTAGAAAMTFLTGPIGLLVVGVTAAVGLFKYLYDKGWSFGTVFEALGDNLNRFFILLKEGFLALLDKITFGDANKAVKQRQAELEAEKKDLDEKEKLRDQKRAATAKERSESEGAKKRAETVKELDKNFKGAAKGIGKTAEALEKSNKTIDMNAGPEALAKQFAEAEGSYLIPKDKKDAAAKADATKKEIETKAEEKSKAEEKAKEETKNEKESKPTAPTQESAESLLAQLNTNMARLVRIANEQKDIEEKQLGVQRSLRGDLFA